MAAWILWTLLTLASWGLWAVGSRMIGGALSPGHQQALSTIGVLPVLLLLGALPESPPASGDRRRGWALAIGSGILSSVANIACYAAMSHGKAAIVVPLTALYPVVTVLLAAPLLGEWVNRRQWAGIGLSLAAIFLFNRSAEETRTSPVAGWLPLALGAAAMWGVTGLMQKAATNQISARSSSLGFLLAFVPVAALILLAEPMPAAVSGRSWAIVAGMGFTLALGNFTILKAFASGGQASVIAPLAGLYPLVSIPIAIAAFDERLDRFEAGGIALAVAAIVLLSLQSPPAEAPATPLPRNGLA